MANENNAGHQHKWRFFRSGGFDQVRLETAEDLRNLESLDQKLWAALACPTQGVEFDEKTLAILDADKDGRIRAPEILAAVKWACSVLKNPGDITRCGTALPLAAIDDSKPEGKKLLASARRSGSAALCRCSSSRAGRPRAPARAGRAWCASQPPPPPGRPRAAGSRRAAPGSCSDRAVGHRSAAAPPALAGARAPGSA